MLLSPNSCDRYFKLGSSTRRYSVIGCIGYENASPIPNITETADVGVGTSDTFDNHCDSGNCKRSDNDQEIITCAICLECLSSSSNSGQNKNKNIASTECGHTFCLSCLLKHLHHSNLCPLCRAPVEQNVKHVFKPLSYLDGIGLLDHELNGLRIMEEVEQFVQNAIEVSANPNTNGQDVEDVVGDIMNMVTNFGFNLLYDAALHSSGSEQQMDNEWIIQMYNNDDDDTNGTNSSSDDSYNTDSDSSDSSDSSDADADDESGGRRPILPEVPAWMFQ
jgi:hypothetical protein